MSRPKGLPKTGGRTKGGRNSATVAKHVELLKDVEFSVERVKQEYGHIAFLDIRDAFDTEGNLKCIQDWPEDLARSVGGIEFEEVFEGRPKVHVGRIHKIKLLNKIPALEHIGKHLGMFVDLHRFVDEKGKDRPFLLSDADRLVAESDANDCPV